MLLQGHAKRQDGQRSLVGYRSQGCTASDITEATELELKTLGWCCCAHFADEEAEQRPVPPTWCQQHHLPSCSCHRTVVSTSSIGEQKQCSCRGKSPLDPPLLPSWRGSLSGSNRHFTSVDELKAPGLIHNCYDFSCVPRKLEWVVSVVLSTVGKNRGRGTGEPIQS